MKLRVLIADDEALSRERIRRFLKADPRVELVAECSDGRMTVDRIRSTGPDLVLLDIQMPELDGFQVLEELKDGPLPAFIFVTAHSQFATRAFDIHAVDYLKKPFDQQRLQTALQRARERIIASARLQTVSMPASEGPGSLPLERIPVRSHGRMCIIKTADIDWVGASDNYVEIRSGRSCHLIRMTIATLAGQLCKRRFVRINRSLLVNSDRVKEIATKSHGDYLVVMQDGTRLAGTRNYRAGLARLLGKAG